MSLGGLNGWQMWHVHLPHSTNTLCHALIDTGSWSSKSNILTDYDWLLVTLESQSLILVIILHPNYDNGSWKIKYCSICTDFSCDKRHIHQRKCRTNHGFSYVVLYCIVLYCIVLYCIVLYCIVLYCIVLYCIYTNSNRSIRPSNNWNISNKTCPDLKRTYLKLPVLPFISNFISIPLTEILFNGN